MEIFSETLDSQDYVLRHEHIQDTHIHLQIYTEFWLLLLIHWSSMLNTTHTR